ncbi:MAG: radical SAM protein [Planctomycetota bacterium]
MADKVVVIRPPLVRPKWNYVNLSTPPIGPAYVAASLRVAGYEVSFVDAVGEALEQFTPLPYGLLLHGLSFEQITARIPPDCRAIGISIQFSFEFPQCRELTWAIRKQFPNAFLFAGGEHATALPEETLRTTALDAIVLGEGEIKAVELLRVAFQPNDIRDFGTVAGICWKDSGGQIHRNSEGLRVSEIGQLPKPAWDLLPLEQYLSRHLGFGVARGRNMPVLASRGCPYQCTFCSSPLMWTTTWTARDVDDLLDEMEGWIQQYQIDNFDFYDLTAIIQKKWIVEFCEKIQERGLKFTWQLPSGTRTEAIDEEVARLLYQSGCRNLSYAPESGSPRILKRIKKKIHPETMLRSLRGCVRQGLNVKTNIILGFPGESWSDIAHSYWFILKLAMVGAQDLAVWCFAPYPGSELFQELVAQGKIDCLDDEYYRKLACYADPSQTVSYSDSFSARQLLILRTLGVLLFYGANFTFRPWRVIQLFWHLACGRYESRSEQALASIFQKFRLSSKSS